MVPEHLCSSGRRVFVPMCSSSVQRNYQHGLTWNLHNRGPLPPTQSVYNEQHARRAATGALMPCRHRRCLWTITETSGNPFVTASCTDWTGLINLFGL